MRTAQLYDRHWMGEKVSEYGIEHGYIDYKCLADVVGDRILCNDITGLFYGTINGEYVEPEQENGIIDNSDEIEELQEQLDELQEQLDELEIENDGDKIIYELLENSINELQEEIDELEREQDEQPEIFQYFIISDNGADFLKRYTDEIVYYLPVLDIYVWGVTHWGTSWDYVLTNIKIVEE
jgi:hypothetical protein